MCVCVSVYVCVSEREREGLVQQLQRLEKDGQQIKFTVFIQSTFDTLVNFALLCTRGQKRGSDSEEREERDERGGRWDR